MTITVKVDAVEINYEDLGLTGRDGESWNTRCKDMLNMVCDKAIELLKLQNSRSSEEQQQQQIDTIINSNIGRGGVTTNPKYQGIN